MEGPLLLGGPASLDPLVSGAKAAGLARAKAAGLPVLQGWVVPAAAFVPAISEGSAVLRERGAAAARLTIARSPIEPSMVWPIRAAGGIGSGAIVRSSSPAEDDARWAGAFSTYHDVIPEDLENAMRGCVASLFSHDALGRAGELGLSPAEIGMAVLVQPWRRFDAGGTAVLEHDGTVTLHAARGEPAGLVGGRSPGTRVLVRVDGSLDEDVNLEGIGAVVARRVATLTRRVYETLGLGSIEWGVEEGRIALLQVRPTPVVSHVAHAQRATTAPARRPTEAEVHLALLALRFPAPLGDRFVLPWAIALDPTADDLLTTDPPTVVCRPADALIEISRLRDSLTAAVWGPGSRGAPGRAGGWAAESQRVLADPLGVKAFDGVAPAGVPDIEEATRLLGLVAGLADALAARGSLTHVDMVWRTSLHEVERAIAQPGYRPSVPFGPGRWDPFVTAVVAAEGEPHDAIPVAPGSACGTAHALVTGARRPGPRAVLVASDPVPQIAPLLWGSAGLVTTGGSAGAHLFEVARSLGVPAVIAPELSVRDAAAPGTVLSVDGDRGFISVLRVAAQLPRLVDVGA